MPISKRVRFEVLKRDGFKCGYCGITAREAVLEVDHIIPPSYGGANGYDNLIAACKRCNIGKSDMRLDYVKSSEHEAITKSAETIGMAQQFAAQFMHLWEKIFGNLDGYWVHSVQRFAAALTLEQMAEAAYQTRDKGIEDEDGRWRYFCGICWGLIKGGTAETRRMA